MAAAGISGTGKASAAFNNGALSIGGVAPAGFYSRRWCAAPRISISSYLDEFFFSFSA